MISIDREKYLEIGRKLRNIPSESLLPSHEWEELVEALCESDDQILKAIGKRELKFLENRSDVFKKTRP